jgi:hypothetical protein
VKHKPLCEEDTLCVTRPSRSATSPQIASRSCQLTKAVVNNEHLLCDSLGSCPGPGRGLRGRYAVSYTHAACGYAAPTGSNICATDGNGDAISHKHAYSDQHA